MNKMLCRSYSTSTSSWRVMSAVCIERKPLITQPLTEFEKKFENMIEEIELNASYKSEHELRIEEEKRQTELLKNSNNIDADIEGLLKQSAQDFEDAGTDEFNRMRVQLGARVDPERDAHLTDHHRKLDHHLVLLTQYHYNGEISKPVWTLPHDFVQPGETLRDAANRVVSHVLGDDIQTYILGNAPFGYYKFKFPKNVAAACGARGGKLFIFKGIYKSGAVQLNGQVANSFQWATRGEMSDLISKRKFLNSIQAFLIDEPQGLDEVELKSLERPKQVSNSS